MTQKKYIKRLDDVTALEITERSYSASVTLLHRGERVHTSECNILLLPRVIEDHRKIYGNEEDAI